MAVHFFLQKVDLFSRLVVVAFKRTLNVQTSNSVVKIWQLIGGAPSHGTTGTMDNPALGDLQGRHGTLVACNRVI